LFDHTPHHPPDSLFKTNRVLSGKKNQRPCHKWYLYHPLARQKQQSLSHQTALAKDPYSSQKEDFALCTGHFFIHL
jgi:hypothetical protein